MSTKNLFKGVVILMAAVVLFAASAVAQNIIIYGSNANPIGGTGRFNVKGNVQDSAWSGGATLNLPGAYNMNGATQLIGGHSSSAGVSKYIIDSLYVAGTNAKLVGIDTLRTKDSVSIAQTLNISGVYMYVGGASSLTGTLTTNPSSYVHYDKNTGSQTVMGTNYNCRVFLTNGATKNFAAAANIAGPFQQTGGAMTVDQNVLLNNTANIASLADVSATKTLTVGSTASVTTLTNNHGTIDFNAAGTISTLTDNASGAIINGGTTLGISTLSANAGTINAGTGPMTVTSLSGNTGTISAATNNGAITFSNAAVNGGRIVGGSGLVTFANKLTNSGSDSIKSGSGGVQFDDSVTMASGAIASGSGLLKFNGDVSNSGTAAIALTGSATAEFAGTLASTGLSFASGSTVTFDGAGQTIPAPTAGYGNLVFAGSTAKTAGGSFAVLGNLTLTQGISMGSDSLTFSQAASTVSGSGEVVGKVRRTHAFSAGTFYSFNRDSVGMSFASDPSAAVTLNMQPGTNPTSFASLPSNYVQRQYGVYSTADLSAHNADIKLYFTDAERQGTGSAESRYGFRKYNGTSWSKVQTNSGMYYRNVSSDPNLITLSAVNQGLSGYSELAIAQIDFMTVAAGDIRDAATWGGTADDVPQQAGDIGYVRHNVTTIGAASPISLANANIVVDGAYTGGVIVQGNSLTVTDFTVQAGRSAAVSSGVTLTVQGTMLNQGSMTIDGGANMIVHLNVLNAGTLTNNGTVTVGQ